MRNVLFAAFAFATLWLCLNLHSRTGYFTYKSEIFGDKAGYYIYLPATFVFKFEANQVSDTLSDAVGNGFLIQDGKIFTKYPIGVAVMQAPFFLVTHFVIAPALGYPSNGFSPPNFKMVDVAAWFYMLLGLWIMSKVLAVYFKPKLVWIALGCFLLGTNLWYYYAVESGMSHIYSFFLVAALLKITQRIHQNDKVDGWLAFGLGAVAGHVVADSIYQCPSASDCPVVGGPFACRIKTPFQIVFESEDDCTDSPGARFAGCRANGLL
ncbi:MAG: hypothetical protein IPP17_13705 [Bacteroidetes bacterium]|nr:hypothetical protein [Bacteroidota bacterium]